MGFMDKLSRLAQPKPPPPRDRDGGSRRDNFGSTGDRRGDSNFEPEEPRGSRGSGSRGHRHYQGRDGPAPIYHAMTNSGPREESRRRTHDFQPPDNSDAIDDQHPFENVRREDSSLRPAPLATAWKPVDSDARRGRAPPSGTAPMREPERTVAPDQFYAIGHGDEPRPLGESPSSRFGAITPGALKNKIVNRKPKSSTNTDFFHDDDTEEESSTAQRTANVKAADKRPTASDDSDSDVRSNDLDSPATNRRKPSLDEDARFTVKRAPTGTLFPSFDGEGYQPLPVVVPPEDRQTPTAAQKRIVEERIIPPRTKAQSNHGPNRGSSIVEQDQRPVNRYDSPNFAEDTNGDASELEPPPSQFPKNEQGAALKVHKELYLLLQDLKKIDPSDKELTSCLSAEKAVVRLRVLYQKAVQQWIEEFDKANSLAEFEKKSNKLNTDLDRLHKENRELRRRNDQLERDMNGIDDRFHLKDRVISMTDQRNAEMQSRLDKFEADHTSALTERNRWWEDEMRKEKEGLNHEISRLANELNESRQGNTRLRQTANDAQNEAGRLSQENARLNEVMKNAISRHEAEVRREKQDKEKLISEKRDQMAALEISHANDTKDLTAAVQNHNSAIDTLKADHEDEIQKLREEHAKALSRLRDDHDIAIAEKDDEIRHAENERDEHYKEQIRDKDRKIKELKDSIARQVADQTRIYKDQNRVLSEKVDDLETERHNVEVRARQQFAEKEKTMKMRHQQELRDVKQRSEIEMKEVKQRNENLVGELVERDAFKGIADRVIEARFKKLAKEIDQFSRRCTTWDKSLEPDWFCSDHVIRNHDNPRQIKQYFVQNMIWMLLYDNVFDTPFKSFGRDGETYFREWIDTYNENSTSMVAPHWPEPTKKSEEWRYNNMQKCMDAVEKAAGDPILKRAYIQSVQQISDDIVHVLGRVISTSAGHQKAIKDIVHQAARLWLDIGIQRCRILIAVPLECRGASLVQDGQRQRELVVQPEVQRIGNAHGENLDMQEIVICRMEVHSLAAR